MKKEYLPATVVEREHGWIDPATMTRYYPDPVDPSLIVYRALTDTERADIETEQREAAEKAAELAVAQRDLTEAMLRLTQDTHKPAATGGTTAWVKPSSVADAYPSGALVTHDGKTWRSVKNFNLDLPADDSTGWIVDGTAKASI